ncbi:hypothetical protein RCL1_002476 [Eukaryota sp. TZLM3-RCL]
MSTSFYPSVSWGQKIGWLFLKFSRICPKTAKYCVGVNSLLCSGTLHDSKPFDVSITFYGEVNVDYCFVSHGEHSLTFVFQKRRFVSWPRLLSSTVRLFWILSDYQLIFEDDDCVDVNDPSPFDLNSMSIISPLSSSWEIKSKETIRLDGAGVKNLRHHINRFHSISLSKIDLTRGHWFSFSLLSFQTTKELLVPRSFDFDDYVTHWLIFYNNLVHESVRRRNNFSQFAPDLDVVLRSNINIPSNFVLEADFPKIPLEKCPLSLLDGSDNCLSVLSTVCKQLLNKSKSGSCPLCLSPDVTKRDSHIIPNSWLAAFRDVVASQDASVSYHLAGRKSDISAEGAKYPLLCPTCELLLAKFENFSNGKDNTTTRTEFYSMLPFMKALRYNCNSTYTLKFNRLFFCLIASVAYRALIDQCQSKSNSWLAKHLLCRQLYGSNESVFNVFDDRTAELYVRLQQFLYQHWSKDNVSPGFHISIFFYEKTDDGTLHDFDCPTTRCYYPMHCGTRQFHPNSLIGIFLFGFIFVVSIQPISDAVELPFDEGSLSFNNDVFSSSTSLLAANLFDELRDSSKRDVHRTLSPGYVYRSGPTVSMVSHTTSEVTAVTDRVDINSSPPISFFLFKARGGNRRFVLFHAPSLVEAVLVTFTDSTNEELPRALCEHVHGYSVSKDLLKHIYENNCNHYFSTEDSSSELNPIVTSFGRKDSQNNVIELLKLVWNTEAFSGALLALLDNDAVRHALL